MTLLPSRKLRACSTFCESAASPFKSSSLPQAHNETVISRHKNAIADDPFMVCILFILLRIVILVCKSTKFYLNSQYLFLRIFIFYRFFFVFIQSGVVLLFGCQSKDCISFFAPCSAKSPVISPPRSLRISSPILAHPFLVLAHFLLFALGHPLLALTHFLLVLAHFLFAIRLLWMNFFHTSFLNLAISVT